ncbi:MAG: hypothetical protein P4L40_22285, partial [Terracidiphilus sp.]|nr:hypothetical protein [Terracidiphilus sp.]
PAGITKLLSVDYLSAGTGSVLFDLGMGVGKFVLQAFVQYPNLKYIVGIELAESRFNVAEQALLRLVALQVCVLFAHTHTHTHTPLLRRCLSPRFALCMHARLNLG